MKKIYVKPTMEVIDMQSNTELLAGSSEHGNSDWGHENACAHGSHAWFCDED